VLLVACKVVVIDSVDGEAPTESERVARSHFAVSLCVLSSVYHWLGCALLTVCGGEAQARLCLRVQIPHVASRSSSGVASLVRRG
jgi:hypothetical protein